MEFEVSPDPQGLVGLCYNIRSVVYDDDLERNNGDDIYNLTEYQLSRTTNLKWSICCPVFDTSNTVIAILALDGKNQITIDDNNKSEIRNQIVVFSRLLYDAVPQLFRR